MDSPATPKLNLERRFSRDAGVGRDTLDCALVSVVGLVPRFSSASSSSSSSSSGVHTPQALLEAIARDLEHSFQRLRLALALSQLAVHSFPLLLALPVPFQSTSGCATAAWWRLPVPMPEGPGTWPWRRPPTSCASAALRASSMAQQLLQLSRQRPPPCWTCSLMLLPWLCCSALPQPSPTFSLCACPGSQP